MRIGKFFAAIGLIVSMICLSGCVTGSVFDVLFNTNQATVYMDGGPHAHFSQYNHRPHRGHGPRQYPVDTTYLYEKYNRDYCVESFGQEVCGRDCRVGDIRSDCADDQGPGGECVSNDRGIVTCGYGCQSNSREMACGGGPAQACFKDAMGDITCGDDCQCNKGQTTCSGGESYRTRVPKISRLKEVDLGVTDTPFSFK